MALAGFKAAVVLHNIMLSNVLKNPMSLFDITPKGRIIARFSSDLDTLDTRLIFCLRQCLQNVLRVCHHEDFVDFFYRVRELLI